MIHYVHHQVTGYSLQVTAAAAKLFTVHCSLSTEVTEGSV